MQYIKKLNAVLLGSILVLLVEYVGFSSVSSISKRDIATFAEAAFRTNFRSPSDDEVKMCERYWGLSDADRKVEFGKVGSVDSALLCELINVPTAVVSDRPEVDRQLVENLNRRSIWKFDTNITCEGDRCNDMHYDVFVVMPAIAVVTISGTDYLVAKFGSKAICIGVRGVKRLDD